MWDALHNAECQPHGDPHKFRARCPVHQGENVDALEVYEGVDRRVVFGCYAHGCDKRAVLDALGLRWTDMFPDGHKNAERRKPTQPVTPRPLNAGAAFLDTLMLAGFNWRAMVVLPKCPYCDNERTLLWVHAGGGVDVECPDGCHYQDVVKAVETRAAIAEAGVQL